jgi:2-oxo-4-hydroxy-4-carboxy-5-ureidoimidazoline decarboxylase
MLSVFNTAPDDELLRDPLRACCVAEPWVSRVVAGRPYPSIEALVAVSDATTADLDDVGLAQALAGHPRIGDRSPSAARTGGHSAWSAQEQSRVADADDDLRSQLAAANAAYEQRFGHVYLVCATDRSAKELLAMCRARLDNDPATERQVMLGELMKINRLRLTTLLNEGAR